MNKNAEEDVSEACTLTKNSLKNFMRNIHSSEYIRPNLSLISARVPERVKKIVQGKSRLYTVKYNNSKTSSVRLAY